MPDSAPRRFRLLPRRHRDTLTERDWERSVLLEPRLAPRLPELISDGGGLPFAPAALAGEPSRLDPTDPAVKALFAQVRRSASKAASRAGRKQGVGVAPGVDGWRLLARTDDEVLFGHGQQSHLLTVTVRREARRGWTCVATSAARPLRATRDGIRASGWRPDPSHETDPADTVLRVLITEQTWAGGQRADGRLIAPALHNGAREIVLTTFVTPRAGYQTRSPNPETPARIALPTRVGSRRLIDGALYGGPVAEAFSEHEPEDA